MGPVVNLHPNKHLRVMAVGAVRPHTGFPHVQALPFSPPLSFNGLNGSAVALIGDLSDI